MEAEKTVVVQTGFKYAMKEILGQFVTTSFWKGLIRMLVQEAFATFLMTMGGVLVHYGKEKRSKEVATLVDQPSQTASRAFGGGYTPTPSFSPQTAFPLSTPQGDNRFPGFGS